jgi:hypothetical protein
MRLFYMLDFVIVLKFHRATRQYLPFKKFWITIFKSTLALNTLSQLIHTKIFKIKFNYSTVQIKNYLM